MLQNFDLNLLLVFQALMDERSVTKAGERLGKTQSAISNALKRLRLAMGDPLFVRTPSGLVPTPRAIEINEQAEQILAMTEICLRPGTQVEPHALQARFSIGAPDRLSLPVFLPFLDRLTREAPGISIDLRTTDREYAIRLIENREIDLALGWFDQLPQQINSLKAFDEPLVCLCRKDHPILANGGVQDLDDILSFPHLVVSSGGDKKAAFDMILGRIGRERNALASVSNFTLVPELLRSSNLIGVYTARTATYLADYYGLACLELPIEIEPIRHHLIWHRRFDRDAMHIWLRGSLLEQCAS